MKTQTPTPPLQRYIDKAAKLFQGKEQYLAWRRQWKIDYSLLSDEIRRTKLEIKEKMRDRSYAGTDQNRLRDLRRLAYDSIELLRAAKMEAQRQYLLSIEDDSRI